MTILVSGAYGFVGSNLSRYLTEKGHRCLALDIARGEAPYAAFWTWDEMAQIPWREVDVIVHLAGKAHDLKNVSDPQSYFDINVGLTERIFNAASGKVPRFIYFSSSKAADADTPYGKSKLAAEQFLAGRAIVLRPAMIHGSGNKGNLNLLWGVVKRGIPWPLAAFENKRSFTTIDNVCAAVEALCDHGENGVYPIADDEMLSTNRLVELMAEVCGRKPRLWRLPKRLMKFAARIGDVLHLPLNSERLGKLTEDSFVDNSDLKKLLHWDRMPVRAEDGMRKTLLGFMK